jgi:deazaflavin-dependent oxidoreductase (nitroreductase family)
MASEDFKNVASQKFIHLTTAGRKTGKPRTVELWFALRGPRLYLSHEGEATDWMQNVKMNGKVEFEIGGKRFTGNTRWLEDGTEDAWEGKVALYEKYYGKAPKATIEDWFSLSRLLAIDPS